ncbi:ribonuclease H-like domain-containing protein [Endogone sp. FLAS-F59071]|nr:ribonuclease H-like domain-containing protein [Endogone sp. FLAS-F59071]|eukprot:RUS23284.1 ribonuclease H-like domain-containing protein [Endogone sp. FLAS-F59071]
MGNNPCSCYFMLRARQTLNLALFCSNVLGMDLEWRAIFKSGQQSKTALLQLCDGKSIMLLQVCRMEEFPKKLRLILEDRNIIKTGLNIHGDALKLTRDYGILVNGLAELGHMARRVGDGWRSGARIPSLQECVAILLGKYLAKGSVRLSNWEVKLSPEQIEYAATDAYVSYVLYRHIERLWPEPGSTIKLVHMADEVANKEKVAQQESDDKAKKQLKLVHMADEVANKEKVAQQESDDKAKKQLKSQTDRLAPTPLNIPPEKRAGRINDMGDNDPESPPKTYPLRSTSPAALQATYGITKACPLLKSGRCAGHRRTRSKKQPSCRYPGGWRAIRSREAQNGDYAGEILELLQGVLFKACAVVRSPFV